MAQRSALRRQGLCTALCKWPCHQQRSVVSTSPFASSGLKTHTVITSIGGSLFHLRQIQLVHKSHHLFDHHPSTMPTSSSCLLHASSSCLRSSTSKYISRSRRGRGIYRQPRRFGGPSWARITTEVRVHERFSDSTHCMSHHALFFAPRCRQAPELDIDGHVIFLCK